MQCNQLKVVSVATFVCATSMFTGCSKDSGSDAAAHSCLTVAPGKTGGYVMCVGNATTATLDLSGENGEQYVVSAYTLGNHDSVKGAGATQLQFKIAATSASLRSFQKSKLEKDAESSLSPLDEENLARLVANRFDIRKGIHQENFVWSAIKTLDQSKVSFEKGIASDSISGRFLKIAKEGSSFKLEDKMLTASCPTTVPGSDGSSTITLGSSYEGTSFCVGYEASPSNETKENVQTSVAAILAAYKDKIYQDAMTTNVKDGYSFSPIIVFVSSLAYDGAFSSTATTVAKRPVLHVKASISKAKLHATIAHEMQHAIVDYYKTRGTTTISETVGVDEGVAHLMEDAFGYGEDNFASYVKNFLLGFVDGSAILSNDDKANLAAARGGANSLMYFMAHRAGGFTVTDGKPFSGDGMKAIVAMVKQTSTNGPSAVAAAFGQSTLVERVGQLIGALYTDNRGYSFAPDEFTLKSYSDITDVLGATGRIFGLRFADFRDYTGATTVSLAESSEAFERNYYESAPTLVKPTGTSTVTLTLPGIENTGIVVTRIK